MDVGTSRQLLAREQDSKREEGSMKKTELSGPEGSSGNLQRRTG